MSTVTAENKGQDRARAGVSAKILQRPAKTCWHASRPGDYDAGLLLHRQDRGKLRVPTSLSIEAALAKCPPNQQQLLHFVDQDSAHKTPAQGAVAFICLPRCTDRRDP